MYILLIFFVSKMRDFKHGGFVSFIFDLWVISIAVSDAEVYRLSLLYPLTDASEVNFMHYASTFVMAVNACNIAAESQRLNISFEYVIDDTNFHARQEQTGNLVQPLIPLSAEEKEEQSLRIIQQRYQDGYDAYVGPGLETCSYQARLAAAFNKPMIEYRCSEAQVSDDQSNGGEYKNAEVNFPTFARTAPPDSALFNPLVAILKKYNWQTVAILSGQADQSGDSASATARKALKTMLESQNITVSYDNEYIIGRSTAYYDAIFKSLILKARVIIFLCEKVVERHFLLSADQHHLTDGDFVFILAKAKDGYLGERSNLRFQQFNVTWLANVNEILSGFRLRRTEFEAVLRSLRRTLYVAKWLHNYTQYEDFIQTGIAAMKEILKCDSAEMMDSLDCMIFTLPVQAAYLYNAVQLYYEALLKAKALNKDTRNGREVMKQARGLTFHSITGLDVHINKDLDAEFNLTLLRLEETAILNPDGSWSGALDWAPFGSFIGVGNDTYFSWQQQLIANATIAAWPNFPVRSVPECGFDGKLCPAPEEKRGKEGHNGVIAGSVIGSLLVIGLYIGLYLYRKYVLLNNMSWKIDAQEIQVAPKEAGSRVSMDVDRGYTENQIFTNVAMYKSQLVSIRSLERTKIELNRPVLQELRNMLDITHENMNPFLGLVIQPKASIIVFQYCPKGSLQDVLGNDDIKLDMQFISSFVRDIAKGMAYLHHSSLVSFGRLKSPNCLVDSRWVIKLTDYGTNFLRNGLEPLSAEEDHAFFSSLLWTAPELLRMKLPPSRGTQKGDVFSFAIILQELLLRTSPYEMHDLQPHEIIMRVKAQESPPFRPIAYSHAGRMSCTAELQTDRELHDVMRMCWAEDPDARPTFPEINKYLRRMASGKDTNVFEHMVKMLEKYSNNLEQVVEERTKLLIEEKKKTDDLIYRMLPNYVAEQLKQNNKVEAERYDEASIYFSDIVGFTTISGQSTPMEVVDMLNDLYTLFDSIIRNYDVYKVETIGDAYMVVSGVPVRNGQKHAVEIADMSLHLLKAVDEEFVIRHQPGTKLMIRIGVHSGPVAAGVVGTSMPRYCLFGDTVNKASRMESNGAGLRIHISEETKAILERTQSYAIEPRDGKVELKNVGIVQTYWLLGKRSSMMATGGKRSARVRPLSPTVTHTPLTSPDETTRRQRTSIFSKPAKKGKHWLTRNVVGT